MTTRALGLLVLTLPLVLATRGALNGAPASSVAVADLVSAPGLASDRGRGGGKNTYGGARGNAGGGGGGGGGGCPRVFSKCVGTYSVHGQACAKKFPRVVCDADPTDCNDFFRDELANCRASSCATDPHCKCEAHAGSLDVKCKDVSERETCEGLQEAECAAKEDCTSLEKCAAMWARSSRWTPWILATGSLAVLWGAA